MPHVLGLRCVRCRTEVAAPLATGPLRYACATCGANLRVEYDLPKVKAAVSKARLAEQRDRGLWRFEAFLPCGTQLESRLPLRDTPLLDAPALGAALGLSNLKLKDDTRQPSASFKDRASAIALSVARERGVSLVVGASTGNAAASTACLAARVGMQARIFVPHTAPKAKLAQVLLYGAEVIAVKGTYDDAFDLCSAACEKHGWFNRNTGLNPYTREGKKTCAFEIAQQLDWRVPDVVAVSVGDGNIVSGIARGFEDLLAVGLIDRLPRLLGVQAEGSDAVTRGFEGDGVCPRVSGETLADSISVSLARDGDAAVQALHASQGLGLRVSDDQILDALRLLARTEGVFAEPAAAATVAGVAKAAQSGWLKEKESVVAVITGSGLKDVVAAERAAGAPVLIEPTLDALELWLSQRRRA